MSQQLLGTSGALLDIGDHLVVKSSLDPAIYHRLRTQALMMKSHESWGIFPAVHNVFQNGYVMDRLDEVHWDRGPIPWVLENVKDMLVRSLWSMNPGVVPGAVMLQRDHETYVRHLVMSYAPSYGSVLVQMLHDVRGLQLTTAITHGDPTLDNVMLRRNGIGFKLTDPIPASSKVPPLRAVDLGKMLQSAFGYERIKRFGDWPDYDFDQAVYSVLNREREDDAVAARYWCAVHFLRLIPYQPKSMHHAFLRIFEQVIARAV